jgi:RNA polymerase-binding protein DksA
MARSTTRSLAGSAAAAAKKVIGRKSQRGTTAAATTVTTAPAKKAPANKTPAKKAPAKKAPAKKAPANQTPATKAPVAKKAPVKKAPATAKAAPSKAPASRPTPQKKTAKKTVAKTAATTTKIEAPVTQAPAKKAPAKKAATKKAAPATLVVKEGEEKWTKAELNEVLKDLNEHADRLRQELHEQEEELAGLMRDAGDGAGHDQADMGATSFERDHELTVVNNARDMLAQTERALARIDDGTYGVCESCGNPIGKMRLMAFPRATLCMSCKQREERR